MWEVMDVTATEVYEVVEDDEDSGPIAEWNMYYRRPTVTSMEKAREDAKAEQIDAMEADEEIMESPRRKQMRGMTDQGKLQGNESGKGHKPEQMICATGPLKGSFRQLLEMLLMRLK